MLSHFSHVWLFVTLRTVARQAPLSMGCSRQEYWSGLPCPPPGYLPDPEIKPMSAALRADPLPLSHSEAPGSEVDRPEQMGLETQVSSLNWQCGCSTWDSTPVIPTAGWPKLLPRVSLFCLPVQGISWTEDSTWPVQGRRLEAPGRWCPSEKLSTRAAGESEFETTPGSPPGGRDRLTKPCSTLSPPGPHLGPQLTTALTPFLRSPMSAIFLTYLRAPLVLSAIASQTGHSTCPWILVSKSASAGATPKTPLRHVLSKGRNPLSSENEATK